MLYGISNDIFLMAMQIVECVYDSDHRVHQSELVLAQAASSSLDLIRQSAFEFLVSAPVCGGSIMSESQVLGRYSNNILWQDGFSDEDKKDAKKKPSLDSDPLLSSPLESAKEEEAKKEAKPDFVHESDEETTDSGFAEEGGVTWGENRHGVKTVMAL